MATEISTWEELLATEAGTEYIWTGGNLNFDEIQPNGFDSTIEIKGSVDFNGATFFNFRSVANIAFHRGTSGTNQYWKNLTFQNTEHIVSTNTYGGFISTCPNFLENIVITGNILCPQNVSSRYVLIGKYYGQGYNNRFDRIGTNITFKGNCPFFLASESAMSDPSSNVNRLPFYDSRIILDIEYNSTKTPFYYAMYNCKISGKIKNNNTSATELAITPYYCAISLESNKDINCPNLNLVRSDLATYAPNSQLVRCDSPFWEHKADISASGFPYGE